jgi:putative ABC transport system permease protein
MKAILLAPLAFARLLYQSIFLALGQIWANKTRSVLTTLGIIIGVASVTAVIASLTGLKNKVLSELESFGTNKIYIQPEWPQTGPNKEASWRIIRFSPEQFDNLLEHCPSVKTFCRLSNAGTQTVRYAEFSEDTVRVSSVEPTWHQIENRTLILGRPFSIIDDTQARNVCLIDTLLRDALRMDRDCIGDSIYVEDKTFIVIGLLEAKPEMTFVNTGSRRTSFEMYIPFRTTFKFEQFPWIWVCAASKSTQLAEEAEAEISFFLRRSRRIKPGHPDTFRIISIESERKKFNDVTRVITLVAGAIVGISLLVGGIGIMNIMLVSVSERTREIGLRKAVGAKNSSILTQFLIEAVVLCFIGGLLGVGLGHLITLGISKSTPLLSHTQIPLWAIGLSFGFSGLVGIFFGFFPAAKAAQLDPIEALRHE